LDRTQVYGHNILQRPNVATSATRLGPAVPSETTSASTFNTVPRPGEAMWSGSDGQPLK